MLLDVMIISRSVRIGRLYERNAQLLMSLNHRGLTTAHGPAYELHRRLDDCEKILPRDDNASRREQELECLQVLKALNTEYTTRLNLGWQDAMSSVQTARSAVELAHTQSRIELILKHLLCSRLQMHDHLDRGESVALRDLAWEVQDYCNGRSTVNGNSPTGVDFHRYHYLSRDPVIKPLL